MSSDQAGGGLSAFSLKEPSWNTSARLLTGSTDPIPTEPRTESWMPRWQGLWTTSTRTKYKNIKITDCLWCFPWGLKGLGVSQVGATRYFGVILCLFWYFFVLFTKGDYNLLQKKTVFCELFFNCLPGVVLQRIPCYDMSNKLLFNLFCESFSVAVTVISTRNTWAAVITAIFVAS